MYSADALAMRLGIDHLPSHYPGRWTAPFTRADAEHRREMEHRRERICFSRSHALRGIADGARSAYKGADAPASASRMLISLAPLRWNRLTMHGAPALAARLGIDPLPSRNPRRRTAHPRAPTQSIGARGYVHSPPPSTTPARTSSLIESASRPAWVRSTAAVSAP